jgi:hypothetical protein
MTPEAAVSKRYILSEYVERAMEGAEYDKLEDGTFSSQIPSCPGVIAFSGSLRGCEEELRSTSRIGSWSALSCIIHYRSLGISI